MPSLCRLSSAILAIGAVILSAFATIMVEIFQNYPKNLSNFLAQDAQRLHFLALCPLSNFE